MSVAEYEIYRRIKKLGEGAFGVAYLTECLKDQTMCVIKQVDLNKMPESERKDTIKEAKILEALKHPNIIRFREVYKTKKGKLCIVMDFADGGDLAKQLTDARGSYISESKILDWFTQICLALKHVHDRKIIHRDLKCQNIFLTKTGIIKLGDFGIARVLSHTRENARTMVGTPYYLSPEIVDNKPYSFKSDIWSLGVILYELCALKPPFDAESLPKLALRICQGKYNPLPSHFSDSLKKLVGMMLVVDPTKRPNINEILKLPVITNRIKGFLTETIRNQEFSHTALHNLKIDIRMRMEDVKQVKNEEPMPADMLRQQMLKEKKDKELLEKIEKDKLDKNRLEKERMDKIRQDAERKLELERKADQERKDKERQLEAERIKNLKNGILFPGEKERDRSPLLRNAITPTAGSNNKGPTKIEFPNAPYTPGILNRNINNRPFDLQPKTPAYNKPDLNKEFNPFLKNDVNKVVVKPIFYANPNKEVPKPENRDISPLKAPEVKRINSTESSENKVAEKVEKVEKIEKVDSNEKPSVSPRNITPIFPKESEKVKDNKSKDPEEKKNRNVLKDLIEENRNKREQFQQELDKKKQELAIEKTESEKRRLEYEAKMEENRKKREKESQNMKEDIKLKKSIIKKNRDEQFDVEVYIPSQDSSSDEEDEIDEREEITPTEKKSSPPEEEKDAGSAKDKEETPTVENDITMEEENLINMINEMKQIVDESTIDEGDENSEPTVTTGVEERDDLSEDSSEPNTPLRDISNQVDHKLSDEPFTKFSMHTLVEESLGADKAKLAVQECSKKLSSLLDNLDYPIEDHYSKIRDGLLQTFDNNENISPNFPYILYKALSEL